MTLALRIAHWASAFDPASLDDAVLDQFGRAIADTFAVAIAGANQPASLRARRYVGATTGIVPCGSEATLWGASGTAGVEAAALHNGIAAHVLDYDDVTTPLSGHPSVAILPALVALGEATGCSGLRLASAYVVAFEVICRLAKAVNPGHYALGWHATASLGTVAAATGCAHLLGLDAGKTGNAIGLAVAMAAGTRANFGTDAKSFQAGQANASAVRAALLASHGFEASAGALDSPVGFQGLYGAGATIAEAFEDLGGPELEFLTSGIEVKKYPLCYGTHRTLDGVLDLISEKGLRIADVEDVHVHTSRGQLVPLIHHRPRTGLEAKFSMQYAVAAALADGRVTLASFSDDAVLRPEIQKFLPRVVPTQDENGLVDPRWSRIRIALHTGEVLSREVTTLRGSARLPLTHAQLQAKIADCLSFGGSPIPAAHLLETAANLGRTSIRHFLETVCGPERTYTVTEKT